MLAHWNIDQLLFYSVGGLGGVIRLGGAGGLGLGLGVGGLKGGNEKFNRGSTIRFHNKCFNASTCPQILTFMGYCWGGSTKAIGKDFFDLFINHWNFLHVKYKIQLNYFWTG